MQAQPEPQLRLSKVMTQSSTCDGRTWSSNGSIQAVNNTSTSHVVIKNVITYPAAMSGLFKRLVVEKPGNMDRNNSGAGLIGTKQSFHDVLK